MQSIVGYEKDSCGNYIIPYKAIYSENVPVKVDKWNTEVGGIHMKGIADFQSERPASGKNYVPPEGRGGGHHVLTTKKRKKR